MLLLGFQLLPPAGAGGPDACARPDLRAEELRVAPTGGRVLGVPGPVAVCGRAKSTLAGCTEQSSRAQRQPPIHVSRPGKSSTGRPLARPVPRPRDRRSRSPPVRPQRSTHAAFVSRSCSWPSSRPPGAPASAAGPGPGRRVAAGPRADGRAGLRPAGRPLGRRPPRGRPARHRRPAGPRRPARPGLLGRACSPVAASWSSTTARRARRTNRSTPASRSAPASAAGAPIGTLDLVGSHCLPRACLHWGWIEGETYLDPLRLVGAGPVRLLPLWRDAPVGSAPTPRLPYAGLAARRWRRSI